MAIWLVEASNKLKQSYSSWPLLPPRPALHPVSGPASDVLHIHRQLHNRQIDNSFSPEPPGQVTVHCKPSSRDNNKNDAEIFSRY